MRALAFPIAVLAGVFIFFQPSVTADTYSIEGDTGDVAFTADHGTYTVDFNHASIGLQTSDEVNGLSAGDDPIAWKAYIYFSVEPGSQGVAGTGVRAAYTADEEEEWLYQSRTHVEGNNQLYDHVTPGEDLDGYDFTTLRAGDRIYFTVASGGSIADDVIWTVIIGSPVTLSVYASADDLGLQAGDDLDAISVYDHDGDGIYDPEDLILFSLTTGSPSAASGATIYAPGLVVAASPGQIGLLNSDEANALENSVPEPSTLLLMSTALVGLMAARRRRKG